MWLPILGIIAGLFFLYTRAMRQKAQDYEALYWTTVHEPLVFIMETAVDNTAEQRAQHAREMLKKHGNERLTDADVWIYIYRVDMGVLSNVHALEQRHCNWYDAAIADAAYKKSEWRKERSGYIKDAAGQVFGGQVQPNQN